MRRSEKRGGNEHFCHSRGPSHFSKSALRAGIKYDYACTNRAGSKTPPRRAGRIMIIQRSDGTVVRAAGWPSGEPKDRSNASGTWAVAAEAVTDPLRYGSDRTTRIRNRTYLHLIAPNALYCLPPAGMDSHGYITDVGCALECATRDLATSCKLFAPHGTADFRHMHIPYTEKWTCSRE